MATENRVVFVRVAALLFLLAWNLEFLASIRPETRNRIHFDRWTCTIKNREIVKIFICNFKYISRTNIRLFSEAEFKSVESIWFHTVMYHKFNGIVYNKFPVDYWENFCDYVGGKREKTFLQNWLFTGVLSYSNLNHSCPYSSFLVRADNISVEKTFPFTRSIFPSGQYHLVVTITGADRVPLVVMDFYGSIGEHYLEKI